MIILFALLRHVTICSQLTGHTRHLSPSIPHPLPHPKPHPRAVNCQQLRPSQCVIPVITQYVVVLWFTLSKNTTREIHIKTWNHESYVLLFIVFATYSDVLLIYFCYFCLFSRQVHNYSLRFRFLSSDIIS